MRAERQSSRAWLPIAVVLIGVALSLYLWHVLKSQERAEIQHLTQLAAASFKTDITGDMDSRIFALIDLGKGWETRGRPRREEWESEAGLLLNPYLGYVAIEWVDSSYRVRWVASPHGNQEDRGRDLSADLLTRRFLDESREERQPRLMYLAKRETGEEAFLAVVPIFRGDGFDGFILGVFRQDFLDKVFEDHAGLGYEVAIFDRDREVYGPPNPTRQPETAFRQEATVRLYGATWRLWVWPTPGLLHEMRSLVNEDAVLASEILIVGLLGLAVHLAQTARSRAKHIEAGSNRLREEIDERQRAEQALRVTETKFRELVEAAPYAIVMINNEGRVVLVNIQTERMFGYERYELLGQPVEILIPERFREAHVRHRALYLSEPRTRPMGAGFDLYGRRKDGTEFPADISLSPVKTAEGLLVSGIIRDISERKQAEEVLRKAHAELEMRVQERTAELQAEIAERKEAEEALRRLSGGLLRMQDEERRRIARELHDSTAQLLLRLAMNLVQVQDSSPDLHSKTKKFVSESLALAEESLQEIRTLSYVLHPPVLDQLGLIPALRSYVKGFTERSGIRVELELPNELVRLPEDVESALYRIVQEALTNVHRHSGSPTATVRLERGTSNITLEVIDYGRGIIPASAGDQSSSTVDVVGVGIGGMRERVRQLGGHLEIKSGTGGTTIKALLPLAAGSSVG